VAAKKAAGAGKAQAKGSGPSSESGLQPHDPIESALSELKGGEPARALDTLLDAWRRTRTPAIADAIDELGKMLSEREPPIAAVGSTSARKAWNHAVAEGRSVMIEHLLEVLPDGNDRVLRLEALAKLPPDPRFTAYATTWMRTPPIHGPRRRGFYGGVIKQLARNKDVRHLPELAKITPATERSSTISRIGLQNWKPLVELTSMLESMEPPALSAEERAALDEIRQIVRKGSGATTSVGAGASNSDPRTFYAKVWENPDDDEARAVLGDLLQQQGDPRGELIALQLARHGTDKPRSARERELEETWGRKWLGAIEPVVMKTGVVFERGFVSRCRFEGGAMGPKKAALSAPEWSTVTHVDCSYASRYVSGSHEMLLSAPARRSMRHVLGLGSEDIAAIMKANVEMPWHTLGLRMWDWTRYVAPLLKGPGKTFPSVTTLVFRHSMRGAIPGVLDDDIDVLLSKWSKVRTLDIAIELDRVVGLLSTKRRVAQLGRLIASAEPITFDLDLTAKRLCLVLDSLSPQHVSTIVPMLGRLEVATVDLVVNGRVQRNKDMLERGRQKMSIAPFIKASKDAGFTLTMNV